MRVADTTVGVDRNGAEEADMVLIDRLVVLADVVPELFPSFVLEGVKGIGWEGTGTRPETGVVEAWGNADCVVGTGRHCVGGAFSH